MHHQEAHHMCRGEGELGRRGLVDEVSHDDMCGCKGERGQGGPIYELEAHNDMCGGE